MEIIEKRVCFQPPVLSAHSPASCQDLTGPLWLFVSHDKAHRYVIEPLSKRARVWRRPGLARDGWIRLSNQPSWPPSLGHASREPDSPGQHEHYELCLESHQDWKWLEKEGQDGAVPFLAQRSSLWKQPKRARMWFRSRLGRTPKEKGSEQTVFDISMQELFGSSLEVHIRTKMYLPAPNLWCATTSVLQKDDAGQRSLHRYETFPGHRG